MSLFIRMVLVMFVTIGAAQFISGALIYSDEHNQSFTLASPKSRQSLRRSFSCSKRWIRRTGGRLLSGSRMPMRKTGSSRSQRPQPKVHFLVGASADSRMAELARWSRSRSPLYKVPSSLTSHYSARRARESSPINRRASVTCNCNSPTARIYVVRTITPITKPLPPWYVHGLTLLVILVCGALFVARAVTQPLSPGAGGGFSRTRA